MAVEGGRLVVEAGADSRAGAGDSGGGGNGGGGDDFADGGGNGLEGVVRWLVSHFATKQG